MKKILSSLFLLFLSFDVVAAESIGSIKKMRGNAKVIRGSKSLKAVVNMPIQEGDKIKTEKDTQVQIVIGLKAIFVAQNTELMLKTDPASKDPQDKDVQAKLLFGKVRAAIGGKPDGHVKMKVYTGAATAGIRGTTGEFSKAPDVDGKPGSFNAMTFDTSVRNGLEIAAKGLPPMIVEPGKFAALSGDGKVMPPVKIDETQFQKKVETFDGLPQRTVLDNGKLVELQKNLPIGVEQAEMVQPTAPFMAVNGKAMPVPPNNVEFDPKTKKYELPPPQPKVVLMDNKDGFAEPAPVVEVVPPPSTMANLELMTNPTYIKELKESWSDQTKSAQIRMEYAIAKAQELPPEKIEVIENKLRKAEIETAQDQQKLMKIETAHLKEYVKQELEKKMETAAPEQRERMESQVKIAQKEIETAQTQSKLLEAKVEVLTAELPPTPNASADARPPTQEHIEKKMEEMKQLQVKVEEQKGAVADGIKQMTMMDAHKAAAEFKNFIQPSADGKMPLFVQDQFGRGFKVEVDPGMIAAGPPTGGPKGPREPAAPGRGPAPMGPPSADLVKHLDVAMGDKMFRDAAASGMVAGMPPPMMGGMMGGGPFPGGPMPPGMGGPFAPNNGREPTGGPGGPQGMPPLPPGMTPEQLQAAMNGLCATNPAMCAGPGSNAPGMPGGNGTWGPNGGPGGPNGPPYPGMGGPPNGQCPPGDPMCGPPGGGSGGCTDPSQPGCYGGNGYPPPPPPCDPGNPACMPPPPPPGSGPCPPGMTCGPGGPPPPPNCVLHPTDPGCSGGSNSPCQVNPSLPGCGGGPPPPPNGTTTVHFSIAP